MLRFQEHGVKVLILAPERDNHAAPVQWALEQSGYGAICWEGLSWEPAQQATIIVQENAGLQLGPHALEPKDVVWIRRPKRPRSHPGIDPADRAFAEEEYRWFHLSILHSVEHFAARCINPYGAARAIDNKALQIRLARQVDLRFPSTLMSNAGPSIRRFLEHAGRRFVCKPFFPHAWETKEGAFAITETFEVTASLLPSDEVLSYAPAIYQEKVDKQADIRLVLLGEAVYSFSLHTPDDALDWRQSVAQGRVSMEAVPTPPEVEKAVLLFASRAGIVYGSFDFAVDRSGDWWFLEVNEQGQFLWLDEHCPDAHMLERFCAFLTLPRGASSEAMDRVRARFPSWQAFCASPAAASLASQEHPSNPLVTREE